MLKKNEITGFERDYLWVDSQTKVVYQFFSDETGTLLDNDRNKKSFKWEYVEQKNAFKIALDGSIFYYLIKSQDKKDEFSVTYKSRSGDQQRKLIRMFKPNIKDEHVETEKEISQELKDSKFKIDNLDSADKVFFGAMYAVVVIIMSLVLKMAVFFSGLSFFMALFISMFITLCIFVYLRDVFYHISKKYKKEIEDIIFKK